MSTINNISDIADNLAAYISKGVFKLNNCTVAFDFNWKDILRASDSGGLQITSIELHDVTFENHISFDYLTVESIDFLDITFLKKASFKHLQLGVSSTSHFYDVKFHGYTDFSSSYFQNAITFGDTQFYSRLQFNNVTAKGEVTFNNITIATNTNTAITLIDFRNAIFEKDVILRGGQMSADDIKFDNVHFNANIAFEKIKMDGSISMQSLTVKEAFKFHITQIEGKTKGSIKFDNTTFNGLANFKNAEFATLSISDVVFNKTVDFGSTKFTDTVSMDRVTFKQKVYFYAAEFTSKVDFLNCTFADTVKLVNIQSYIEKEKEREKEREKEKEKENFALPSFNFRFSTIEKLFMIDIEPEGRESQTDKPRKAVDFDRLKWDGDISFDYCLFNDASTIILRAIRNEKYKLSLDYTNIFGNLILQDIKADSISMENATVSGKISIVDSVKFKHTGGRHTNCILKNEALRVNDKVNYLIYRKREHIKIFKDWFSKKETGNLLTKSWKKVVNFINGVLEFMVVALNLISNNFGKSWILGCLFTVSMSALFVAIMQYRADIIYFTLDPAQIWANLDCFFGATVQYLWLPNMAGGHKECWESPSPTIFVLGKILVGFGIYQTIAAFRRYGK